MELPYYTLVCGLSGSSSAWLERCVRDAEVAGSNPVSPIPALDEILCAAFISPFVCAFVAFGAGEPTWHWLLPNRGSPSIVGRLWVVQEKTM